MMSILRYVLICCFPLLVFGQEIQDDYGKTLDFTVLSNGTMSIMYDGQYQQASKSITGYIQAYDYKGRVLYDRQYQIRIADSLLHNQDSLRITEAYAISASKQHSLFYGRINHDDRLSFVIVIDKRGRFKKNICFHADFRELENNLDTDSYRAKGYFYLYAYQNKLRIGPYLNPNKFLFAQVYIRPIQEAQQKINFDALSLSIQDNHTLIHFKDDVQIKWGHRINGVFEPGKQLFKLTETPQAFYFVLYEKQSEQKGPIIYVIEKSTGKIQMQTIPTMIKA